MDIFCILIIYSCIHCIHTVVPDYFYPFGPEQGDNVVPANQDGSSGEVDISVQFPFFDQLHSSLYVNTIGVVSFLTQVSQYTPDAFPLADNRRLVAPFWADVDSGVNDGAVYYKEIQDPSILSKVTEEVRKFFVDQSHFHALWAFIATWDQVTYNGGGPDTEVNTFQAVLTTNGHRSFVIFNFGNISWTYGTAGDQTPAQVGFNAGDGIHFFSVPGSHTPAISNVESTTNIGQPGRWVFQVDEENIKSGGCNTEGSVVFGSQYSAPLGGKLIYLAGPCFDIYVDQVVCDFDGFMVEGVVITAIRAACVSPATFSLGKRPFKLSVDGGNTFDYTGDFWFGPDFHVIQVNKEAWMELKLFQDLRIEWDSGLLTSSEVSVDFVTIKKDKNGNLEMIEIPLTSSTMNNGSFQLPDILENTNDLQLTNFGAIRIREIGVPSQRTQCIWTPIIPALWYTNLYLYTLAIYGPNANAQMKSNIGVTASQAWDAITNFVDTTAGNVKEAVSNALVDISDYLFEDKCNDWHAAEQANPPDLSDVPTPPCTMGQAINDPNFKPALVCNMGRGICFFFHPGAFHCVRSAKPSTSGAAQRACYNREGELLSYENGGGTYDRADNDGHSETGKLWRYDHVVENDLPFIYCCKVTRDNCDKYEDFRPTIPCDGYDPPSPAWTGGDPHAETFDGALYTFNGVGEYWLVKTEDLRIQMQGRAEPITSGNGLASVWRALAMKISTSNTVQVQINEHMGVEIMIDGKRVNFDERMSWEYEGVIVTANTTQVGLHFLDGAHVQVTEVDGSLSFIMVLASTYKDKTRGLLGVWNDDKNDDLLSPDGTTVDISSSVRDIHDIGNKWRISEAESLFEYPAGSSYDSFQNPNFNPTFDILQDDPDAVSLCGSNTQCVFDYLVTGSTLIAQQTKMSMQELEVIREEFKSVPKSGSERKAVTMGLPVFLVMIAVDLYLILPPEE